MTDRRLPPDVCYRCQADTSVDQPLHNPEGHPEAAPLAPTLPGFWYGYTPEGELAHVVAAGAERAFCSARPTMETRAALSARWICRTCAGSQPPILYVLGHRP